MDIDTDLATIGPIAGAPTGATCDLPRTAPPYSLAGAFLEALGAQDFARMASLLAPDAHLEALLPRGFVEWRGPDEVRAAFTRWFGGTERFELIDATVGDVGGRLLLRWRAQLQAERLGDGWFVVEQQAFVDPSPTDGIGHLALLCSGYRPAPEAP